VAEKKTHEVTIEQGMRTKQRIVLKGEAGCTEPGLQPGDVVLVIAQKDHAVFTRPAASPMDLIIMKPISLKEALCGVHFTIKHLDGRTLSIKSVPGEVIKPNSFKVVTEEGMPVHTRPYIKGNLYIKFEVSGDLEGGWVWRYGCKYLPLAHILLPASSCGHEWHIQWQTWRGFAATVLLGAYQISYRFDHSLGWTLASVISDADSWCVLRGCRTKWSCVCLPYKWLASHIGKATVRTGASLGANLVVSVVVLNCNL
jgi:hypothetical protein